MSLLKNLGFAVCVAFSVVVTAACGADGDSQFVHSEQLSKSTFKGDWPVNPESGVLACDSSKGNAVTFAPTDSSTIYAVNGPAVSWGKQENWPDAKEIWNGVNWGSFIDSGLKLCEGASGSSQSSSMPASSSTTTSSASAQPLSPEVEKDLRGYFSPVAFWDQNFTAATSAECTAAGADILYSKHAWRLPGGGLACSWGPLDNDAWGGRIESFQLYFDPPVNAQAVLAAIASILPADAEQVDSRDGLNGPDTKYPDGSCQLVNYASNALAAAVSQVSPSWTGEKTLGVALYTGASTDDCVDRPFSPVQYI